jgi:hypothetical protein
LCNASQQHSSESDGQTERVNRILEDVLRHFVGPQQDDWVKYLKTAQFAINNSWQESVRHTPFFLNHGRHPNMPGLEGLDDQGARVPTATRFVKDMRDALKRLRDV